MKRCYLFALLFFLEMSFGSELEKQCDKKEPRYFLNPGCAEGFVFEELKKNL